MHDDAVQFFDRLLSELFAARNDGMHFDATSYQACSDRAGGRAESPDLPPRGDLIAYQADAHRTPSFSPASPCSCSRYRPATLDHVNCSMTRRAANSPRRRARSSFAARLSTAARIAAESCGGT